MESSEPSSPTTASSRLLNIPEKQDLNMKSHPIMLIEDFKKDINDSLMEVQKNINEQLEDLRRYYKNHFKK